MNIKRWEKAISILEKIKPEQFDFADWADEPTVLKAKHVNSAGTELRQVKCNTVGCAIGWIASDPSIRKQGFILGVPVRHGSGWEDDITAFPVYKGGRGANAISLYFDIPLRDAEDIFISGWKIVRRLTNKQRADLTPADVIFYMKEYQKLNQ